MTADYAELEARVDELKQELDARVGDLEQQMRHILPARIDAVAYGLSVSHEELREFRGETNERLGRVEITLSEHGDRLDSIDTRLGGIDTRLDRHGELLEEILRRLPEA